VGKIGEGRGPPATGKTQCGRFDMFMRT